MGAAQTYSGISDAILVARGHSDVDEDNQDTDLEEQGDHSAEEMDRSCRAERPRVRHCRVGSGVANETKNVVRHVMFSADSEEELDGKKTKKLHV